MTLPGGRPGQGISSRPHVDMAQTEAREGVAEESEREGEALAD